MAYTFSRDWFESIECPFCEKGEIRIHKTLPIKKENISTTVGGRRARTGSQTPEKEEVQNDCPKCGAKRKDIQKKLKEGVTKTPSNREILKRLQEAGLPTKVGGEEQEVNTQLLGTFLCFLAQEWNQWEANLPFRLVCQAPSAGHVSKMTPYSCGRRACT